MFCVSIEQSFDSAHFLKNYEGKCRNIHGHRWRVVIEILSEILIQEGSKKGMLVDFGDIKKSLKTICDELDHSFIFEKESLRQETYNALMKENFRLVEVDFVPTAENFAKYFFDRLSSEYQVKRVKVYETPNNCAIYGE